MSQILDPAVLGTLIPIVGILVGGALGISAMWIRHRERMAMIEAGMHPYRDEEEHAEDEGLHEPGLLESAEERTLLEPGRVRPEPSSRPR